MFDHVSIRVPDRAVAERFFETVLIPLGMEETYRTDSFAFWHDFSLAAVDDDHPVTRGVHVAFAAPSREQVDDFWQTGTRAGYTDDGAPGERRDRRDDAYSAALLDPNGNRMEAVHHGALRADGKVEHVTIRVADVPRATTFYRTVAASAGFDLRDEGPERTTATGASASASTSGGSFALVPGPPTEHLHMAFPGDDDAVRRFYDEAVAAGHRGNGEPGERPWYHPGYYAAYVLDPDGNNIEVVNHHLS